jgi:hypothetical protein
VLLGQLTRLHHAKAQGFLGDAPLAVFLLAPAKHAVPMPASGRCSLAPPWLLPYQRPGGLWLFPGRELLPYGPGAWA